MASQSIISCTRCNGPRYTSSQLREWRVSIPAFQPNSFLLVGRQS